MFVYTPPKQRASQYTAALAQAFATLRAYTRFSCAGTVTHQQLQLQIEGVQELLQFPLDAARAGVLRATCQRAVPEGSTVREASNSLHPSQLNIVNQAEWQAMLMGVVAKVTDGLGLGCTPNCVDAELVKLVYCEPGSNFEPPRQECKHAGGQVTVQHAGAVSTYGRLELAPDCVNYVAFYSDCKHDIKKVTAGHRVCLVYNLHVRPQPANSSPLASVVQQQGPEAPYAVASPAQVAAQPAISAPATGSAALIATMSPYMVRPGTALLYVSPSPGRRIRRLAMRGHTPPPAASAGAAEATGISAAGTGGAANATAAAAEAAVSGNRQAARALFASAARPLATVNEAPAAIQLVQGKLQTASVGVPGQPHVSAAGVRLVPADVASAVAALAGGFKDWVWHGSQQKPGALYILLEEQHKDHKRYELGAAGLRGNDAVRVQTAISAAAEAGVKLALVTLKRTQVKTEVQAVQPRQPFDWSARDEPTVMQPQGITPEPTVMHVQSITSGEVSLPQSSEESVSQSPVLTVSKTIVSDTVTATDWILLNGRSHDAGNIEVQSDELLLVNPSSVQSIWRPARTVDIAQSCISSIAGEDNFLALAMWPKPIHDHPGWGSDNEGESMQQEQENVEQDPMDSSPPVGSKRPADVWGGLEAPGSATKRLKSPYEQGKRAERTPEYYGRPYGFGP